MRNLIKKIENMYLEQGLTKQETINSVAKDLLLTYDESERLLKGEFKIDNELIVQLRKVYGNKITL